MEPPIFDLNGCPGSQKIRNFKPDWLVGSDWHTVAGNYVFLTKNVDKTVKFHQKLVKVHVFCKSPVSQCSDTHSEHPSRSGIKKSNYRYPQTPIWCKIGGFHTKSPNREQMLLLPFEIVCFLKLGLIFVDSYSSSWPQVQSKNNLTTSNFLEKICLLLAVYCTLKLHFAPKVRSC